MTKRYPMQPLVITPDNVIRFKKNNIVEFLLKHSNYDLNDLHTMSFPNEDWEQFNQLIGYSVSGYGDLSYIDKKIVHTADKKAKELLKKGNIK